MKWITTICITAILSTGLYYFSQRMNISNSSQEEPIYIKYSDAITDKYIKDMSKQHKLAYFGGGGAFLYNVKNINISFASREIMDLDQSRKLLISCSEELLRRINANDRIRPYLEHFPFSEKGIDLSISYFDSKLNHIQSKYIAGVFIINGNICYAVYDQEASTLKTVHKESY